MTWSVRPTSARSETRRADAAQPGAGPPVTVSAVTTQPVLSGSRDAPAMGLVVGAVLVALAVAVVKPWAATDDSPRITSRIPADSEQRSVVAATTAPAIDTDRAVVAEMCLEPIGWRMFASERWPDRSARRWVRVEPFAGASGPADPRIPLIQEPSLAVLAVGYCAPVTGLDRPPSAVSTTIYRLRHGRSAADPLAWDVIRPRRVLPSNVESSLGGAWAPPVGADASVSGWTDTTIVLNIAAGGPGSAAYSRWFGVVIDVDTTAIE
jgi:hypothetical protein